MVREILEMEFGISRAGAAADEWLKHNEPVPHEQVLAELGRIDLSITGYCKYGSSEGFSG